MNRSGSTAHRIMKKIPKKANKQDDECISVSEFCKGKGLPEWDVQKALDLLT